MVDFLHKAVGQGLAEISIPFQPKHLQAQCLTLLDGNSLDSIFRRQCLWTSKKSDFIFAILKMKKTKISKNECPGRKVWWLCSQLPRTWGTALSRTLQGSKPRWLGWPSQIYRYTYMWMMEKFKKKLVFRPTMPTKKWRIRFSWWEAWLTDTHWCSFVL